MIYYTCHHNQRSYCIRLLKIFLIVSNCYVSSSDFEDDGEDESDGGWQQELQRRYMQDANFMAELRARHPLSPPETNHLPNQGYPDRSGFPGQNYIHGQNFKMQGICYPQNSGQKNYSAEQMQDHYGQQVCSGNTCRK